MHRPRNTLNIVALKIRLIILFFLQFATWGSYLTSMGNYLGHEGLGEYIGYFYSVQGLVSIFMPTLFGILADRKIEAQRLLGLSHIAAALLMIAVCLVGLSSDHLEFSHIFPLYALSVAFYMPTLGLSNSVSYTAMQESGLDKVNDFPKIRIFVYRFPHRHVDSGLGRLPTEPAPVPYQRCLGHNSWHILVLYASLPSKQGSQ